MTNILKPFIDRKITSLDKALEDLARYMSEKPNQSSHISHASKSSVSDSKVSLMEFSNVFQISSVVYDPLFEYVVNKKNLKPAKRHVLIEKDFSESHLFDVWKVDAEDTAKTKGNLRFFVPSLSFFYSICKSIALAKKELDNREVERNISKFLIEKFSSSHLFLTDVSFDYFKGDSINHHSAHYKPNFLHESTDRIGICESNGKITDKHTRTLQGLFGTTDTFEIVSNIFRDVFNKKISIITGGFMTDSLNKHPVLLQIIKDSIYLRCDGEYETRYPALRVCY